MKEILKIRQEIDKIDDTILKLLSKRFQRAHKIGLIKFKLKLPLKQNNRIKEMQKLWIKKAKKLKLSKKFITNLFHVIHQESLDQQKEKIKRKG
ncbi:MAG: chorismate mutase [Bacteriovoracaceae bacterium]